MIVLTFFTDMTAIAKSKQEHSPAAFTQDVLFIVLLSPMHVLHGILQQGLPDFFPQLQMDIMNFLQLLHFLFQVHNLE